MTGSDWLDEAFFDVPEPETFDGGTTSDGHLWHAISPRWGHSMHTMCSYHGMFPAKLVHYFLQRYSQPGALVLDPFSGRGTTVLQARAEGRIAIGNDLNPLAFVLSRAKAEPPAWHRLTAFLDRLEGAYKRQIRSAPDVGPDIVMLFHPRTLSQLVYLRERLMKTRSWAPEDFMLAAGVAGILHGSHRADGSSAYLSISMPNTFSMSPQYVEKYIRENNLERPEQDVFGCLRDKLARLYLDATDGAASRAYKSDAIRMLNGNRVTPKSVDLVVTSPPYLQVVNYATSNWIRLWWLGVDDVGRQRGAGRKRLDKQLDHRHNYDSYRRFMLRTFRGIERVLRKNAVAVFVIGDVAEPDHEPIQLAHRVWEDVGPKSGLKLVQSIEDSLQTQNKVSRIWRETRGQATDRDRVLVLCRDGEEPTAYDDEVDWSEPYKDAGPDAAHEWVRGQRFSARPVSTGLGRRPASPAAR